MPVTLRIRHTTQYRYRSAVTLLPHRLMMTPRSNHELTLVSSRLLLPHDALTAWSQDVAGNMIASVTFATPVVEFAIIGEAVVEQSALEWPVFAIDPHAQSLPFAYSSDDATDLARLAAPDDPDPTGRVATWTRGFVMGPTTDTLSLLKAINAGLLDAVRYRVRDEEGTQSPAQTLAMASGSCRDIAALFIEGVRSLGLGARAVSGYLYDPEVEHADGGSTHAWAEVFLPGAGWVAFDPTHRRMGSAQLIGVAVGRSNRQIMPVTGGFTGAPDAFLDMAVSVRVARDV